MGKLMICEECKTCTDSNSINRCFVDCYHPLKALNEFKEMKDKQEQGLLIELPCKVGDKVYIIVGKDISEQKIVGYKVSSLDGFEVYTMRRACHIRNFGKTVFLTRSEAEEALAKMGE